MAERKVINAAVRKQVLTRDKDACRKCGNDKKLELHHVLPVADNGPDEVDNLVALCTSCHREWEHLIYPNVKNITFAKWLDLPSCLALFAMFLQEDLWKDNFTAKETRDTIIKYYAVIRDVARA